MLTARALPSRSRDLSLSRQNGCGAGRLAPPAIPALEQRSGRIPALPCPPSRSGQYNLFGPDCKICLPKRPSASYKYSCPGSASLAGFEVATYGRFSGGRRGRRGARSSSWSRQGRHCVLAKHLTREAVIGPVKRTDLWTLPVVAVREAVMNAIVHADYAQQGAPIRVALFDDRLEIENPGLLPFGLTIEDIQKGISKLCNRVVGRVFQELGLMEHWGSGIQRMTAACQDQGLDAPNFEEIGTHFRVTLSAVLRKALCDQ